MKHRRASPLILVLLLVQGLFIANVRPVAAAPAVVPDAASQDGKDTTASSNFSPISQFAIGVVVQGITADEWLDDLFAFQFRVNFQTAFLTAQGVDPLTGASDTVGLGESLACNFDARVPTRAFAPVTVDNAAGFVLVGYTMFDSLARCDATADIQLARVLFEINQAGQTDVTVTNVVFTDEDANVITTGWRESIWYDVDNNFAAAPADDWLIAGRTGQTPTALEDDPLIKFFDKDGNGVWTQPVPSQPKPQPNVMQESVVLDTNNDGIFDSGERVLAGARPVFDPQNPIPLIDDPLIKYQDAFNTAANQFDLGTPLVTGAAVTENIVNSPPVASFTFSPANPVTDPDGLTAIAFDLSGSSDPDGSITNYFMDFGDGLGEQDVTALAPVFNYDLPCDSAAAPCTFDVTLRVVDNQGSTGAARDPSAEAPLVDSQPSHKQRRVILASTTDRPPDTGDDDSQPVDGDTELTALLRGPLIWAGVATAILTLFVFLAWRRRTMGDDASSA